MQRVFWGRLRTGKIVNLEILFCIHGGFTKFNGSVFNPVVFER